MGKCAFWVHLICSYVRNNLTSAFSVFELSLSTYKVFSMSESGDLSSALNHLLTNSILFDVVLQVDDKKWQVHKCILSIRSKVFEKLFTDDSEENFFRITDVNTDAFDLMIKFIYTNRVEDMKNLEVDLYYLGDRYQLSELKSESESRLLLRLNVDNCFDILLKAMSYNLQFLVETTKSFIAGELSTICTQSQWMTFVKENPEISANIIRDHFHPFVFFSRHTDVNAGIVSTNCLPLALLSLLKRKIFSDVIFKVQGREFVVHKCILAMRSEVFATMFTSDFKEKKCNTVEIEYADPDAFHQMIKFIYTNGTLEVKSKESCLELMCLADRYQIQDLKKECELELEYMIDVDSCLDILVAAIDFNASQSFVKFAKLYIAKRLPRINIKAKWTAFVEKNSKLSVELVRAHFSLADRSCKCKRLKT